MFLTWRYHRSATFPRATSELPASETGPSYRERQTPIARFTQTSTTSMPTFS
jgi:hypothetical protein